MQTRHTIRTGAGVLILATLAILLAWSYRPTTVPLIGISVQGYTSITFNSNNFYAGRWIKAQVVLTNQGSSAISYDSWDRWPKGWVKAQTAIGWTNLDLAPRFTGTYTLVPAGSNIAFTVVLSVDTVRWQLGFPVQTSSMRQKAAWQLSEVGGWNKFNWFWERSIGMVPDKTGPEIELQSAEFEIPTQ